MNELSLESFYGGKQGVSPVIRARFKYVDINDPAYIRAVEKAGSDSTKLEEIRKDTMELCFENINYEDVWYGQMALIDTLNKRNPNNGKLFRRVLTRTEDEAAIDGGTLHGEYIGRIIGPSEGYPRVELGSLGGMINRVQATYSYGADTNEYIYPVSEDGAATDDTFVENVNELKFKEDGGKIQKLAAYKGNNQLIPGYNPNTHEYETGIHYSWVNVRSNIDGEDQETYVYLGFQIPFTYLDFNFNDINWDDDFNTTFVNRSEYADGTQPFYQKWQIEIPRGTQGNQVGYLRRVKFGDFRNLDEDTTKDILYPYEDVYSDLTGQFEPRNYDESPYSEEYKYPQFEDDKLAADTSILVYTYYMYDKNYETADKRKVVTCYFGKIIDIENINLNDDGTLVINYSSGASETLNTIKWIDSIEMFSSAGQNGVLDSINIIYNTGEVVNLNETKKLRFVEYIQLVNDTNNKAKKLQLKFTDKDRREDLAGFSFFQLDGILIDPETKEVKYHTDPINADLSTSINNYRSFVNPVYLNSLDDIFLDDDGHIYIRNSSSESRYDGSDGFETEPYLPYARDIYQDDDGQIWKRGGAFPDAIVESGETEQEARLRWIWWLDLGLVKQNFNGVRIAAQLNIERYDAYYEELHPGQHFDWDALIASVDPADFIEGVENILNTPWTLDNKNVSPYANGNIFIYEQGYNTNLTNPKVSENRIGQLVYFEEYAFYFDANSSLDGAKWKCAGSWSSSDSSMQLRIKTDANSYVPSDVIPHDKGFTIVTQEEIQETFNWSNVWEV